ncbi:MAG TPA: hypothetical protein VNB50_08375 [Gaiellaceae bacterium]|jgi:hypothetical protein|nr:hypothetical protein [Gaiellaceae bacterium]
MSNGLLAAGPPPLTEAAADAAIEVIDFMAAQVRGVDEIDVTPAVRQAWRAHLASYYPYLAPVDRFWFANAPFTLAAIQTGWAQLDPQQQGMYKQAWAMSLPAMLQLVDPVLQAQQAPPQAAFGAGSVADHVLGQPQPTAQLSDENAAQEELYNHSVNLQLLTNMSTVGANNTIGLMQAYNRMS